MNLIDILTRRGYRTTEFWLAILTLLVGVGNRVFDLNLDEAAILGFAGVAATFIFGRQWEKRTVINNTILTDPPVEPVEVPVGPPVAG